MSFLLLWLFSNVFSSMAVLQCLLFLYVFFVPFSCLTLLQYLLFSFSSMSSLLVWLFFNVLSSRVTAPLSPLFCPALLLTYFPISSLHLPTHTRGQGSTTHPASDEHSPTSGPALLHAHGYSSHEETEATIRTIKSVFMENPSLFPGAENFPPKHRGRAPRGSSLRGLLRHRAQS